MNALSRTRCTRLLVAFGLCLMLAGPVMLLWASRAQQIVSSPDGSGPDVRADQLEIDRMEHQLLPHATARPEGFSPFGQAFKDGPVRVSGDAPGRLRMNIGDLDPKNPEALMAALPADLRLGEHERLALGPKGTLAPGLNYAMLGSEALSAKSLDTVLGGIREAARIVSFGPNATLLLYVEAGQIGRLRQNPDVAFFHAVPPGDKISLDTGRRPLIETARATDPNFLLDVALVPGSEAAAVREEIARVPGVVSVADYGPGGSALLVRADYHSLGKLARIRQILNIQEDLELMSLNAKESPSIQVGTAQISNQARPFDDIGVDGGGIDTNGDGQRDNRVTGEDLVPPQLVGVLDNGISADTPSFSQTATQVFDLAHPFPSPQHRKVHSIIAVRDNGDDCDATLDGAGSHGNTVASVIGAWPSGLGVFATRSGIGNGGQPRNANLDGVARGARIIVSDIAGKSSCTINSLVERGGNVDPGSLAARLTEIICPKSAGTGACTGIVGGGSEVHLAVLPFGAPDNFSTLQFQLNDGTYPLQSADIDTFLYNNRDFMTFAPAGNSGVAISTSRASFWTPRFIPDLFDGSTCDEDPNRAVKLAIQIPPPATAKNGITVGLTRADEMTTFANFDNLANMATFSSRGPATPESLRMAPILDSPGSDLGPGNFETASIAVFRSRDDDNLGPVDAQIDEGNYGTSYAAAGATGAAAIVRDYFAQGMYPTGDRTTANRVPNVSGALVKASLVASARFTTNIRTPGESSKSTSDKVLRRTRSTDIGTLCGTDNIGVLGNSEQGYGRIVLTNVLPLPNWSKSFRLGGVSGTGLRWTAGNTPPGPMHWEFPAQGLLVWDDIATAEPAIDNTHTSQTHTFRVASATTIGAAGTGLAANKAQLRVALAWTDPPSPPASGGPLVNDLDLVLEGPGPDNCLSAGDIRPDGTTCPAGSDADNRFYDGNVYPGTQNPFADQWSKTRLVGQPETHDRRNPQEAVHLSFDPNNDTNPADSQIFLGTWRVTVKRGQGGAIPGQITITGPNEDANGNRRLDPGEDTSNAQCTAAGNPASCCTGAGTGTCTGNGNLLLDLGGQTYALVVAGPVYLAEGAPSKGPSAFPLSSISLDKIGYSCEDTAVATIFDSTPGAGATRAGASTTFTVQNAAGQILDTESGIIFTASPSLGGATTSSAVPVRRGVPAVSNDGVLEADSGMQIVAVYAPTNLVRVTASAKVDCSPNFVPGFFAILGNNVIGPQNQVGGGCDNDDSFDAGEVVTYGVALTNRGRDELLGIRSDDYNDVAATLTPSGPGAGAIHVLDSPKNLGHMPAGQVQGVFFHVFVDPTAANALSIANRVVTMTLTLDSLNKGKRLSQQSYAFPSAINADRETLHYSTDFPAGGRQVRDLNRNLVIDRPDILDPVELFFLPDEDVTFSSMFTPIGPGSTVVSNILGEDLDNDGLLDHGETDIVPNGVLDRGILFSATGPTNADKVPWNFDSGSGGWVPIRHPQSNSGGSISPNPMWEYMTSGLCGFQTALSGLNHYGIWHTGDGNPATPPAGSTVCDNYDVPRDLNTQPRVEIVFDVLHSPVVAKVNQLPDARGFSYGVEFQRLAMNINDEVWNAGYTAMGVNIDNNLDVDSTNCFLCQEMDDYYTRRGGGWAYAVFNLGAANYFTTYSYYGISPSSTFPFQRTFGPFADTNGGTPFDGGNETGFSSFISANSGAEIRTSPIPTAQDDYLKFPRTGAPVPGICSGGTNPGAPCPIPGCLGGGICTLETITTGGPVRNFEGTLVGYEGGFAVETLRGISAPETINGGGIFNAGPAGNRWGIALGWWSIESSNLDRDYGFGVDDVVFEWDESHPKDESAFSPAHTPACSRFNTPGNPAGGQCATITVDRTNLYDCEESVEITVDDPKKPTASSVDVMIVTDSDADLFSTARFTVLKPKASKRYTLPVVSGQPGLFRGNVTFSGTSNTTKNVYTSANSDSQFIVYYVDPLCDGDGDGQAGEDDFDNLDGDNISAAVDNCPLIYNPGQEDGVCVGGTAAGAACSTSLTCTGSGTCVVDGDNVGALCDNCPTVANPGQADANADGVGDACEYDDVDSDGVDNGSDNCPDLYNPDQAGTCGPTRGTAGCQANTDCATGSTCDKSRYHGFACSNPTQDLDADGVFGSNDNCTLTANGNQRNNDLDALGDVCDGDCDGVALVKICSNLPAVTCTASPGSSDPACGAGGVCQTAVRHPSSFNCGAVDDDADQDGVDDGLDNCPGIYNPTIIPGTKRQLDTDRDGLGDACDPAGSSDDDFNGVPDDLVTFSGVVNCRAAGLARFSILATSYEDIDGDHDPFPDTGETGLVTVTIQNTGPALTNASFVLQSTDPNVACIQVPRLVVGSLPARGTVTIGSLTPLQAGSSFTFRASDTLQSTTSSTARINLCLTALADQALGGTSCFKLLADVDIPGGGQTFIAGTDGATTGTLRETFDVDHNGDGHLSTDDIFRLQDAGTGIIGHASFVHGSLTGVGTNIVAGVACGGYQTPAENNPACALIPDLAMDWHYHCPTSATNCPNTESGGFGGASQSGCVGGCSYKTPADGQKAFSPPNSLHMGAHFDSNSFAAGDTTHLRTLQAFQSGPINLAVVKRGPDDLKLSFFHIVDLVGGDAVSGGPLLCHDCAQVQVQVDRNADKTVDDWGSWDTITPTQNVYDKTVRAWSTFGAQFCEITPTDTGTDPPAPRGVHETMCYNEKAWSHCGSAAGTGPTQAFNCDGGVVDPAGTGVWVQSQFNLDGFLGQRIRIRWIATTWSLDNVADSYFEKGPGWSDTPHDDGWWLDNIDITGVLTTQATPTPDPKPAPPNTCPTGPDSCIETTAGTDRGTLPAIKVTDLNGSVFGAGLSPTPGQSIRVTAANSTIPGGCANGGPQFIFTKNGAVVQDWSSKNLYLDTANGSSQTYAVQVRCSSDTSCTSVNGASTTLVYFTTDPSTINYSTLSDSGSTQSGIVFGSVHSAFDARTGVEFGGVCVGGTTKDSFCVTTTGISGACAGGPTPGAACFRDLQCGAGGTCSNPAFSAGCPGACALGPTPAAPCFATADCGVGGTCTGPAPGTCSGSLTVLNLESPGGLSPNVYRGTIQTPGQGNGFVLPVPTVPDPTWSFTPGTACFLQNLAVVATNATSGTLDQTADPNPPVGTATFYTANTSSGAARNGALGCANPAKCFGGPTPNAFCSADANCGAGGRCLLFGAAAMQVNPLNANFGCPLANPSPYRVPELAVADCMP